MELWLFITATKTLGVQRILNMPLIKAAESYLKHFLGPQPQIATYFRNFLPTLNTRHYLKKPTSCGAQLS